MPLVLKWLGYKIVLCKQYSREIHGVLGGICREETLKNKIRLKRV